MVGRAVSFYRQQFLTLSQKGGALQATRSTITLKGSVDVVVEFFSEPATASLQ